MHNYTEKVDSLRLFAGLHKKLPDESRFGRGVLMLIGALIILLSLPAVGQDLEKKIALNVKAVSIREALAEIQKQSGVIIGYGQALDQYATLKVTLTEKNISVKEAIDRVLKDTKLEQGLVSGRIVIRQSKQKEVPAPKVQARVRPGTISGKIIDGDSGEPLIGSTVMVKNSNEGRTTDVDGKYTLTLAPGIYDLEFRYISYETKLIQNVTVSDGEITTLDVAMKAGTTNLGEVVVTAEFSKASVEGLLAKQKNNTSMTDGISAEQIRLTPDNNAAQVLKRVSGITVQNDKFVTIRGMSDRYNNVLINGATMPSTEPNRRNFSFDIVPSQLVDNIVVNKTASPDLPGEFTGGLVQINTKSVPEENFLNFTIGTGFNTASANQDMISFKRDDKALLGMVDDDRKYFGDGRLMDQNTFHQKDQAEILEIGSKIPNRWQFYSIPYQPVKNYQLAGGISKKLDQSTLGFIAAATYLNEQLKETGISRINNQYDFTSERYRYNTTIGGMFNTAWKSSRHMIAFKNLYNQRYTNQFDNRMGYYASQSQNARRTGEVTLYNQLWQSRIDGEHKITNQSMKLEWYVDYTSLNRDQPDTRFMTGQELPGYPGIKYQYNLGDGLLLLGGLHSSLLKETRKNAGVNLGIPVTILNEKQLFKVGYAHSVRDADFDAGNFRIKGATPYVEAHQGLPYYGIVTQEAFANGDLVYEAASTRAGESLGDEYTGTQTLKAGYAMLDLRPFHMLRLTGGVRLEDNEMYLNTVFYSQQTGMASFRDSTYHERDWLPSANIIVSPTEKINFRMAYSKTLARPDFVERSPYIYYDFTELAEVIGQEGLKRSLIENYDIRLEYYPSPNEIFSASVFRKKFKDPVERFYNIGSTSNTVEYRNLYEAFANGFEIDARKSLSFINPGSKWLNQLFVSANYTHLVGGIKYLVHDRTSTGSDSTYVSSLNRPIQGLSPYIINAGINYQDKLWGINVVYNKIGRRIVNGGTDPYLVQYENPRDVIDIQLSLRLLQQKLELKINVSDILNQSFVIYSNTSNKEGVITAPGPNNDPKGDGYNSELDFTNYKVKRGTNVGINLTYKL